MMPARVWEQFRNLPSFNEKDIVIADWVTSRLAGICFTDLRDMHHQVIRSVIDDATAGLQSGTASVATAREYMRIMNNDKAEFEGLATKLEEQYCKAWSKSGVILGKWRRLTYLLRTTSSAVDHFIIKPTLLSPPLLKSSRTLMPFLAYPKLDL